MDTSAPIPFLTYHILTIYDSACVVLVVSYDIDDTKAAEYIKRDMTLDKVTLKQGETHCRRGLITDPLALVVTDVDADLEQNQPSDAESIEMHVPRVWVRESSVRSKLLSTEATFGFC